MVVIFDCVGRSRSSFDYIGVVFTDPDGRIISDDSMMRHASVPDMAHTEFFEFLECGVCDVVEFSNSIFLYRSPRFVGGIGIGKKSGKNLINNGFLWFHLNEFSRIGWVF